MKQMRREGIQSTRDREQRTEQMRKQKHMKQDGWSLDNIQKYRRGAGLKTSLYNLIDDRQCCQEVRIEV